MDETYSEEQWKRFTHGAYLPYRQPFQSGVENVILALDMGDDPRSAVNNLARDISIFKLEMADLLRADKTGSTKMLRQSQRKTSQGSSSISSTICVQPRGGAMITW